LSFSKVKTLIVTLLDIITHPEVNFNDKSYCENHGISLIY